MKLLLDEDVPEPLVGLLQKVLIEHEVVHVGDLRWKSKKDIPLYADARSRGFDVILTNDLSQFNDPDECTAIRRSGMHHVTYELADGLEGLALACASILAAMRPVVGALAAAPSQRIVRIASVSKRRSSFTVTNPATDAPSPYW
jgi:hypothetical protein